MQYRYFDNEILSLNESKETVSTKLQGELVNIEKIKKLYKVKSSVKAMVRSISSLLELWSIFCQRSLNFMGEKSSRQKIRLTLSYPLPT